MGDAEGRNAQATEPELRAELDDVRHRIERECAPLAALYDLRTHGGIAHPPSMDGVREAAEKLGLPPRNWHRTDYLRLLGLVRDSVDTIASHLVGAAQVMVAD